MEIWDAYDRHGEPTGALLIRGEPIPDGMYHLVSEVLVRHQDGDYLLMKRSLLKPNFPGCYEATAGGSALQGEDDLACAKRELLEETGLTGSFREVGRHVCDENHTIYVGYLCCVDAPKDAVRLQEGETEGYLWMSEDDFRAFMQSDKAIPVQVHRWKKYLAQGLRIVSLTPGDDTWQQLITYARDCSWRAGAALAKRMQCGDFSDWECVFAAMHGLNICGYCTVSKADCIPDVPYTPYIGFVFVDENCRGQRLSEKLIACASDYLQSFGFDRVHIVSDHDGLYEKYGFQVIDRKTAPWGSEEKIYMKKLRTER